MMFDVFEIEKTIKDINDKEMTKKNFIKDLKRLMQKTKSSIRNILVDVKNDMQSLNKAAIKVNEYEEIYNENLKKSEIKKKTQEEKPKKKSLDYSENYSTLLKQMNYKVNKMNYILNDLRKFNGKSLQNLSSQYYRTSRPKSAYVPETLIAKKNRPIKTARSSCLINKKLISKMINKTKSKSMNCTKIEFRDNNNKSGINESVRLKINSNEKKFMDLRYLKLDKIYKEKIKKINFGRLNNIYRVELIKSLAMFTPIKHLKDMKKIQFEDISVKKDIMDINKKIDEKIDKRRKSLYFKRQYEKRLIKNRIKKSGNNSCFIMNNSHNMGSFKLRANYSSRNLYTPKIKTLLRVNLHGEQKGNCQKEKVEKKIEALKGILGQLGDTLDTKNMHQYINEGYKSNRKNSTKKELIEMQNKYFPILEEVNQKINEMLEEEKKTPKEKKAE